MQIENETPSKTPVAAPRAGSRHVSASANWKPPNEAVRRLYEHGSSHEIGRKLDVSHTAVGKWLRGSATPTHAMQLKIEATFGIALPLWKRRAVVQAALPTPRTASDSSGDQLTAHDRLVKLLARVDAARKEEGPSTTALRELDKLELSAIRELARADGSDLTEEQLIAHPAFDDLIQRITKWLSQHAPLTGHDLLGVLDPTDCERAASMRARYPELTAAVDSANRALADALEAARIARSRA